MIDKINQNALNDTCYDPPYEITDVFVPKHSKIRKHLLVSFKLKEIVAKRNTIIHN